MAHESSGGKPQDAGKLHGKLEKITMGIWQFDIAMKNCHLKSDFSQKQMLVFHSKRLVYQMVTPIKSHFTIIKSWKHHEKPA